MKSLQDKGMKLKILTAFLGISLFAIAPTAFVVFMGWATIEFKTAVIAATMFLCLFLLTSAFILLGFDLNITSKETDKKINLFFKNIEPYIQGVCFILGFLCLCYLGYLYYQNQ